MPRLLDMGLERLTKVVNDMARLSQKSVETAIEAFVKEKEHPDEPKSKRIFDWSEELRILQDEASELAVELIARYQPMASDLRFIKSCMEISYGFSRFGRYAYDIVTVLDVFGDLSMCDHSPIIKMGGRVVSMIKKGIKAFIKRDVKLAESLRSEDDIVDDIYKKYVKNMLDRSKEDLKCSVSATLILRYLERIADHAQYIGDSVIYVVTGERALRK
jgi:phosphate transport system protein